MAQTPDPSARSSATGRPDSDVDSIELGWTVYDAVQRPVGNVTDVDLDRRRLVVDGRPVGFGEFEVPLTAVRDAGDNDVHLALTVDPTRHTEGAAPLFTDQSDSGPSRAESTRQADSRPRQPQATRPTPAATTTTSRSAPPEHGSPAQVWTEREEPSGFGRWMPYVPLLAAGGVGAAAYYWWRRRQRKTYWERATAFVGDRHPAW